MISVSKFFNQILTSLERAGTLGKVRKENTLAYHKKKEFCSCGVICFICNFSINCIVITTTLANKESESVTKGLAHMTSGVPTQSVENPCNSVLPTATTQI